MRVRDLFCLVSVLLLTFLFVPGVSAHGRTPRLEISTERMNPGSVLDIRGVEFDYEELVTLYMERQGIVVSLGEVHADLEGIFIHTIVLPVDLPLGEYTIRGVTEHHDVLSPVFAVEGSAIMEGGGQGERDEDDGLLAPMPTYAPGVVPGGGVPTVVSTVPQPAVSPDRRLMILAAVILAALAGLVLSRSLFARNRSS